MPDEKDKDLELPKIPIDLPATPLPPVSALTGRQDEEEEPSLSPPNLPLPGEPVGLPQTPGAPLPPLGGLGGLATPGSSLPPLGGLGGLPETPGAPLATPGSSLPPLGGLGGLPETPGTPLPPAGGGVATPGTSLPPLGGLADLPQPGGTALPALGGGLPRPAGSTPPLPPLGNPAGPDLPPLGGSTREPRSPVSISPLLQPFPASSPAAASKAQPASEASKPATNVPKDSFRDIVETIVFVIVLVLLLKTFVAEAFVIPTGSMATTLWGYQKVVTCPECGLLFPVNASSEADPQQGVAATTVTSCTCPNCRLHIDFRDAARYQQASPGWEPPSWNSGDRVLVSKFTYDSGLQPPKRLDVVVFKYPVAPQRDYTALNYIKRLIGLPGETVGIYYGDIYIAHDLKYDAIPSTVRPEDLWQTSYMHVDQYQSQLMQDAVAADSDQPGRFTILRKPPAQILAMSRLVYDNNHQAKDLVARKFPPRWSPAEDSQGGEWQLDPEKPHQFRHPARSGAPAWLRYQHLLRDGSDKPQPRLITDFLGYNTQNRLEPNAQHWVGDLILECQVKMDAVAQGNELILELAKGADRFQAVFELHSGECTLHRQGQGPLTWTGPDGKEGIASVKTSLNRPGTFTVRLANVDRRLTVWVNDELPFGDGVAYDPPKSLAPTDNDLEPARLGVRGAPLTILGLKLLRDTYYSTSSHGVSLAALANPDQWQEPPAKTLYVQPGHYLCLGDNSTESSDGREWGAVPERLLLGRALVVYYPFRFPGLSPVNRVGFIR